MMHKRCVYLLAGLLLSTTLLMGGCATRGASKDVPEVRNGQITPFLPVQPAASIQLAEGRYPTLFAGTSTALWTDYESDNDGTAAQLNAMGLPRDTFVVIQCRLESAFADMSIAYDAVGLRGIQAYILTSDQRRIAPVQIVQASALDEEARGALKVFRRTNTLIFAKRDITMMVTHETGAQQSLRLMLEGYSSSFYFEWSSFSPKVTEPLPFSKQPAVKKVKKGMKEVGDKVNAFSHTVD